jgi:hypothetical protein
MVDYLVMNLEIQMVVQMVGYLVMNLEILMVV